jgi:protein TonB
MSFDSPVVRKAPRGKRGIIAVLLAVVLAGGVISMFRSGSQEPKRVAKKDQIITIQLPPPAPPPPPPTVIPPPPPPDKQEEMVKQEPVKEDEKPPDNKPPDAPPPLDLGPGVAGGTGPSLGGPGGGGNGQIGGTGRGGSGSRFGWYAAKVQSSIKEALQHNSATRSATMNLTVRIWPDSTGRITRAELIGTTGNAAVDQALRNQILTGLQLPQAPPADMPTPIVMRIEARKPNL